MKSLFESYKQMATEAKEKTCKGCDEPVSKCSCTMDEELKGKQKKLDKNHNGKLDAQDFAILRKEDKDTEPPFDKPYKTVKGTGTVTDKSGAKHTGMSRARDLARSALNKHLQKPFEPYSPPKDNLKKQHFGMAEEVEQIEELSKGTLGSYIKKAKGSAIGNANAMGMTRQDSNIHKKSETKMVKRAKGIDKAVDRLTTEETQVDEAFVNGREYASHGLMHPDHAKMDIHQPANREVDFYASKTGDKMLGKVTKNDGKQVHIQAHKELGDGKLHKFKVTPHLPKQVDEVLKPSMGAGAYIDDFVHSKNPQFAGKSKDKRRQMALAAYYAAKKGMKEEAELEEGMYSSDVERAFPNGKASGVKTHAPVAPVPDRKYIKGTPEWKAHKEKSKPINGHPTNSMKEAINDNLHPAGAALLKHIKPEHHNKYKAHLTTDTFNGSYKDRTDVLNAAKKAGHLKEEAEQIDELSTDTLKSFKKKKQTLRDLYRTDASHQSNDSDRSELSKLAKDAHKSVKKAAKKIAEDLEESSDRVTPTVKTAKYSWGTMKTIHHGSNFSIPLHPEHHEAIAQMKDQQQHTIKTEDGRQYHVKREGDTVHFHGVNGGNKTSVPHKTMTESAEGTMKSFKDFITEIKLADLPVRTIKGKSYGNQPEEPDHDDEENETAAQKSAEKRGRGRPAGSKSGARQIGGASKKGSGVDYTGYKLHLPNSNKSY